MIKIELFLKQIGFRKTLLILSLGQLALVLILSMAISLVDDSLTEISFLEDLSLINIFLVSVLIAPIIETAIFQFAVIEVMAFTLDRMKYARLISVLISGLLFGFSHSYNVYYVLIMIVIGIFFGWTYTLITAWKSKKIGFWSVTFIHALNNLTGFVLDDLIGI